MIRANLERLVSPHHQPCLIVLLVPQQSHIARTPLLPILSFTIEFEELRPHLEGLLFALLVCGGFNLLGEVDNGLEMLVLALFDFFAFL